jgi:hypothetical protein
MARKQLLRDLNPLAALQLRCLALFSNSSRLALGASNPEERRNKMLLISFKKATLTEKSNILEAICRPASRI